MTTLAHVSHRKIARAAGGREAARALKEEVGHLLLAATSAREAATPVIERQQHAQHQQDQIQ